MTAREIHLTETSPGFWELLLGLPGRKRRRRTAEDEARAEAFFDNLASQPNPPRAYRWFEGWTGLFRVYIGLSIVVFVLSALLA